MTIVRSRFDIDVIREARRDVTTSRALGQSGPRWQALCSDVAEGHAGYCDDLPPSARGVHTPDNEWKE